MPIVPNTKIWLRKNELNATCELIEAAVPLDRTVIAYDLAVATIHRQKQGMNSASTVAKFIIKWWFNHNHIERLA